MSYNGNYNSNVNVGAYRGGRGGTMVYPSAPTTLPVGWQIAYTATGETYYIDHNTRTTHWQIPAEVLHSYERGGMGNFRAQRPRRGIDRTKLKTKMCMNIENGGKCSWGANCAFAHSSEELSTHPHFNPAAMSAIQGGQPMAGAWNTMQQQSQQQTQQSQQQQQQQQAQPVQGVSAQ